MDRLERSGWQTGILPLRESFLAPVLPAAPSFVQTRETLQKSHAVTIRTAGKEQQADLFRGVLVFLCLQPVPHLRTSL